MNSIVVDGIRYDAEFVQGLIDQTIELRDASIRAEEFIYSVGLSHTICVLNHYKRLLEGRGTATQVIEAPGRIKEAMRQLDQLKRGWKS